MRDINQKHVNKPDDLLPLMRSKFVKNAAVTWKGVYHLYWFMATHSDRLIFKSETVLSVYTPEPMKHVIMFPNIF